MIASTYTDHGAGMRGVYVFAYNRGGSSAISFTPATLGIPGQSYVYNYYMHVGQLVGAGQTFTDTVTDHDYYLVAPVGASGIAFLGDAGKFVSLGKKRVTQLTDNGTVQATLTFAANESSVTVYGYAPSAPLASASNGTVSAVTYAPSTGMFSLTVTHGTGNQATISLSL